MGPCDVFQSIIEVLEEFNPACLTSRHLLWFAEILKVFVIRQDFDRVLSSKEEGSSAAKAEYYAGEFSIVNIIVLFGREQASGVECNWVHSIFVFLGNDHSKGVS